MSGSYRRIARGAIEQALRGTEGMDRDAVIARIDEARPFSPGSPDYPYKVWLEERRIALARLQGKHLTLEQAAKACPEKLVPLKPDPAIEAWLRKQGRRRATHA